MSRNPTSMLPRLLLALLFLCGAPEIAYAAPTIDIAEARALPLGSIVTVKGTVTVPSGVFVSGTFDQGFAIQDKAGVLYVSVQTNLGLRPRDQVEVTGQLVEVFGVLNLVRASVDDIKWKGHGHLVTSAVVATGAISEATKDRLVERTGIMTHHVSNDLPFGYRLFFDNGSGEAQAFI